MSKRFSTHEIRNQPSLFEDVNLFTSDRALMQAVASQGGGETAALQAFGAVCGSAESSERARLANDFPPRLKTHDAQGRRLDAVEFHPAYHALMTASMAAGVHASAWDHLAAAPGAKADSASRVARAAMLYMAAEMEPGHCCPITMTNAAVPLLLQIGDFAKVWLPKCLSRSYDPRFAAIEAKSAATFGMGMTEKQGGTDVRSNTTEAAPEGSPGRYILTGHKWFMSAPMSDAFFVLAQAPSGLSCFFMPRILPDGATNAIALQRLKDKLGNRSNASSEVEFRGADAWLVGEEGRGIATIIDMVTWTRLDCALSSAGLMRSALAQAIHHCQGRSAFGKPLYDQPLMRHVLADIALDVEAATLLALRLASAFDDGRDEVNAAWRRLMTPVTKYWVCKIAPQAVGEAMECLGGNGYTEAFPLARTYREAPVNAIWEGSGNVMALDVVRVLSRDPEAVRVVLSVIASTAAGDAGLTAASRRFEGLLAEPAQFEIRGRVLTERLAHIAAAALLKVHAPAPVAEAFIATRLSDVRRQTYGQGVDRADIAAILDRAAPAL